MFRAWNILGKGWEGVGGITEELEVSHYNWQTDKSARSPIFIVVGSGLWNMYVWTFHMCVGLAAQNFV